MLDQILSLLFPERCRGCNAVGTALCAKCEHTITPAVAMPRQEHCFALFDYSHPLIQKAVWELKYHRKSPLAKVLLLRGMPLIPQYISSLGYPATIPIVLVPIPQYYTKTYSRGFNQSTLLARWMKAALPTATLQPLLRKTRATESQAHTHSKEQRQKNLSSSMRAFGSIDPQALYVIVDDVITTGSTITEASRALGAAGATRICAIALAHGYSSRH